MSQYLRKDVVKMAAYTPGEQINNATKLNTNECAWGPAPGVLKALAKCPVDALRLYPSPLANKVREAASEVFEIDADQVLVGNGSDDCLTIVMRSFLSKGDLVACPWPTYSLYDTLATIQGVEITHVDWLEGPDKLISSSSKGSSKKSGKATASASGAAGWHLPISDLLATKAKVVFIATPNNPSATLVPLEELELLASKLKGILVVDEAYIDYATAADGKSPAGLAASFIPKLAAHPNVLVLRTFSKSYSMAGARLGLMFASKELTTHMNKVKDSYNVNSMTQIAGEAALKDRKYWNWLVSSTIAEREWLLKQVGKFGWTWPKTDANFVLFNVGSVATASMLYDGLKKQGLLVRYWGSRPDLNDKLRVTIGTRESNERVVSLVTELLEGGANGNGKRAGGSAKANGSSKRQKK